MTGRRAGGVRGGTNHALYHSDQSNYTARTWTEEHVTLSALWIDSDSCN